MSKYRKLEMPVELIFSIFETYVKVSKNIKSLGVVELYNVYSNTDKLKVEDILLKYVKSSKKIVTNKLKPLKLTVTNIELFSWKIVIHQENAQGDKLYCIVSEDNLPKHIFDTLKPISNDLRLIRDIRNVREESKRNLSDLAKGILFLKIEDTSVLANRKDITSFEKSQIIFSYKYFKSIYDENVSKIDDFTQHKRVLEANAEVKPILDKLEDLISLYGLKIEEGE